MNEVSRATHSIGRSLRLLVLLAAVVAIAGCSRIVGPRSFAMSAVTVNGETRSVVVNDTSDQVTDVRTDPAPAFADATGLPFNPPGSSDLVVIPWTGGACDRLTTFSIASRDGGGLSIKYRIEVAPGDCDAIGVGHQLVLTTSPAVPAASVTLNRAP